MDCHLKDPEGEAVTEEERGKDRSLLQVIIITGYLLTEGDIIDIVCLVPHGVAGAIEGLEQCT